MFTIHNISEYSLTYSCECGAEGKCMFVPVSKGTALVLDLKCPLCSYSERLKISSDENTGDSLQWGIIIDNDLNED